VAKGLSECLSKKKLKTRFYVSNEGEGLVRFDGSEFAYLRASGWVRPLRQRRLRPITVGEFDNEPGASCWKECGKREAREYAQRLFNGVSLDAPVLGRRQRLSAYLENHDLHWRHPPIPYGPAPWRISRERQEATQNQEAGHIGPPKRSDKKSLDRWIRQAREGYEQAQSRIDGIQQRASFVLGAAGVTTAAVLANGGLIYGRTDEVFPSHAGRIVVGALLGLATLALAVAAYAAIEATMIMFELAEPNSSWQVKRRMSELSDKDEPRFVLATILLATQRAEVIGDWKIRQVKRARRFFGLAILLVLLANLSLLAFSLLSS
jgi:hypothetical protein